jgi:hypothetical protein
VLKAAQGGPLGVIDAPFDDLPVSVAPLPLNAKVPWPCSRPAEVTGAGLEPEKLLCIKRARELRHALSDGSSE